MNGNVGKVTADRKGDIMTANADVAEAFIHGEIKKSKNMFSEKDKFGRCVVYSYGYHFPIAVRINASLVVVNKDSYSNTTAHHKSLVLSSINSNFMDLIAVSTDSLKRFINTGVLLVDKEFKSEEEIFKSILLFYKEKGVNTLYIKNRLKKFFDDMRKKLFTIAL